MLQEAVLSLLRHPEYCVYGYSDGLSGLGLDRAEDQFNRESLAERGKFKQETLVNFGPERCCILPKGPLSLFGVYTSICCFFLA